MSDKNYIDKELEVVEDFHRHFQSIERLAESCYQKYTNLEYLIACSDKSDMALGMMYADFKASGSLILNIVEKELLFKSKDLYIRFLKFMVTSIHHSQHGETVHKGGSMLHVLIALEQFDAIQTILSNIRHLQVDLDCDAIEMFIHLLYRDTVYKGMQAGSFLYQMAAKREGIVALCTIASEMPEVFFANSSDFNPENIVEKALLYEVSGKDGQYRTALSHLACYDEGIIFLNIVRDRIGLHDSKGLAKSLMLVVDDSTVIESFLGRSGGSVFIMDLLLDTGSLFYLLCDEMSIKVLIGVLASIPMDLFVKRGEALSNVIDANANRESVIAKLAEIHEGKEWLGKLFRRNILDIDSLEKVKVFSKLALDENVWFKVSRSKNRERICMDILSKKEMLEDFLDALFMPLDDTGETLFFLLASSSDLNMGRPVLDLMLMHPEMLRSKVVQLAQTLLKEVKDKCAIDVLLGYPQGQDFLEGLFVFIPKFELWGEMLNQSEKTVYHFSKLHAGRLVLKKMFTECEKSLLTETADTMLSGLNYVDSNGRIAFSWWVDNKEGRNVLYSLMLKSPWIFEDKAYSGKWIELLTTPFDCKGSEIDDQTGLSCLVFSQNGNIIFKYMLYAFKKMITAHINRFIAGLTHIPKKHAESGYSGVQGLLMAEPGVSGFCYLLREYEGVREERNKALLVKSLTANNALGSTVLAALLSSAWGVWTFCYICKDKVGLYAKYRQEIIDAMHVSGVQAVNSFFDIYVYQEHRFIPVLELFKKNGWFLSKLLTFLNPGKTLVSHKFWGVISACYKRKYALEYFAETEGTSILLLGFLQFVKVIHNKSIIKEIMQKKGSDGKMTIEEMFKRFQSGWAVLTYIDELEEGEVVLERKTPRRNPFSPDSPAIRRLRQEAGEREAS